jgi:ribosomal protein S18 acetylase RimI-like enzyme
MKVLAIAVRSNGALLGLAIRWKVVSRKQMTENHLEETMKIDNRKLVFRPMTHSDKAAVLEIDRAVSGKERAGYIEGKFFRATEGNGQLLNSLVAEHEGRVIGFVIGEIYLGEFGIPNTTAAIDTIGVHPDFQRSGVAHRLLEEYKSHAREAGVTRLHTLVDWNDWKLIHFFDSVGFSPATTLSLEVRL